MSEITIPSVKDIMDHAEKTGDDSATKPVVNKQKKKENLRWLNHDNTWNKEGILSVFDEREDEMIVCTASGVPLFFVDSDGRKFQLEPFGYCAANGKPYHRDHLRMPDDVGRASYPIQYNGYLCHEEFNKPLSPEELAEIRAEHGI